MVMIIFASRISNHKGVDTKQRTYKTAKNKMENNKTATITKQ